MSLFKRLLEPLFKKQEQAERAEKADHSSYYPEQKLPVDERFTYYFKKNGGKFLYCEHWDEVLEAFDNIMLENDWYEQDVFCINEHLIHKFDGFNLNFVKKPDSTFFLSTCESLIADNGSILLCSNQIKEKKLSDLPFNFIIFATTSQIVESISEGMRVIKNQNPNYLPTSITTIKNFEPEKEKDFMSYGSSTKNLYLLLLEDL